MDKEVDDQLVLIDVTNSSDEELIDLGANLDNPIEIGTKLKNIGVPDRNIIIMLLNYYVNSEDSVARTELFRILDIYDNETITRDLFEESIDNIIYSSIIDSIIVPDTPPTYKESIAAINEYVEDIYIQITSKDAPKEFLRQFISHSIEPIAFNLFTVYNMEEYNQYIEKFELISEKRKGFIKEYRKALTLEEKQKIQRAATEWESSEDRDSYIEEYTKMTYEAYGTEKAIDHILEKLLKKLFPNSKDIEIQPYTTPNSKLMGVDKITYSLAAGYINFGETKYFKMEKGRSTVQITTSITLDIEGLENMLPDNINGEDINLLESIITLYDANIDRGIDTFTINDIYRVERRNLSVNPNSKVQEQLINKIKKLMKTLTTIDSSQEKDKYYPDLEYELIGNLLNAEILKMPIKGNETTVIKVVSPPLLYRYAKAKRQLTKIPFELTENRLVKTDSVLNLENYLLRRIAQMRNKKDLSRNILYSTIYSNMNYKQKSKKAIENAKAKTRINTEEILKCLVLKEYIKDYHIEKEGRNQYHRLIIEL